MPFKDKTKAKEYSQKYYQTNKEKWESEAIKKKRKEYRKKNKDKYNAYQREYWSEHTEERKANSQRFRETPKGRATILMDSVRQRAKKSRGRIPNPTITIQDVLPILNEGICQVTGLPFDFAKGDGSRWTRNPYAPSIDRIDNTKGYEPGNIRIVLWAINAGCWTWGLETAKSIWKNVN